MISWKFRSGLCVPHPPWGKKFFVAVTGRAEGNMKEPDIFSRTLTKAGFFPHLWAGGTQVHGKKVRCAAKPTAPENFPSTDGLVTDVPGLALRVFSADCAPVFIIDPRAPAVAAVHAGRRGAENGILAQAVKIMGNCYNSRPSDLWITLGPHIRSCCYEVGDDMVSPFKNFPRAVRRRRGRAYLDLAEILKTQAGRAGIPSNHFSAAPHCTGHDRRFFSYRREKTEERQAGLIAIRS